MDIEQKRIQVIEDAFNSCLSDSKYLFSLLQSYYSIMSDEEIEQLAEDAFGDKPDWM